VHEAKAVLRLRREALAALITDGARRDMEVRRGGADIHVRRRREAEGLLLQVAIILFFFAMGVTFSVLPQVQLHDIAITLIDMHLDVMLD
jgi:hypothetical protein